MSTIESILAPLFSQTIVTSILFNLAKRKKEKKTLLTLTCTYNTFKVL